MRSSMLSAKNSTPDRDMGKISDCLHCHVPDTVLATSRAVSPSFLGAHMLIRKHYSHFPVKETETQKQKPSLLHSLPLTLSAVCSVE